MDIQPQTRSFSVFILDTNQVNLVVNTFSWQNAQLLNIIQICLPFLWNFNKYFAFIIVQSIL